MRRTLHGDVDLRRVDFNHPAAWPVCQCPDPRCSQWPHTHLLGEPQVVSQGDHIVVFRDQPIAVWSEAIVTLLTETAGDAPLPEAD